MKQFGKDFLIVLTLGIILTSVISQSNAITSSNNMESSIQNRIDDFENDIEAGIIIDDGNIDNKEVVVENNVSNISSMTVKFGNFITRLISKVLEFIAKLFGSLIS